MKSELLKFIHAPVCIADGQDFGEIEEYFCNFLKSNNIEFTEETHLYSRKADLSKYSTICFSTTGTFIDKIDKLMDFDLSNLKTIVVLNEVAFNLVKYLANEIGVNVLGFFWPAWDAYKATNNEQLISQILFFANHKWGNLN